MPSSFPVAVIQRKGGRPRDAQYLEIRLFSAVLGGFEKNSHTVYKEASRKNVQTGIDYEGVFVIAS